MKKELNLDEMIITSVGGEITFYDREVTSLPISFKVDGYSKHISISAKDILPIIKQKVLEELAKREVPDIIEGYCPPIVHP